jgi:ribosomal protein S18 acetylase RimI-like enzyme
VAEVQLVPEPEKKAVRAIVGAVVFESSDDSDHLDDGWFNRMVLWQDRSLYIMTLGVIDEMRSRGLAKKLLDKIIECSQENPSIKFITLHVVDYNRRAINFYRKHGFELLEKIQ